MTKMENYKKASFNIDVGLLKNFKSIVMTT
jgi:hypothetical protein